MKNEEFAAARLSKSGGGKLNKKERTSLTNKTKRL
jgi:hypothetical protein